MISSVLFNFEKACDSIWRMGILKKLHFFAWEISFLSLSQQVLIWNKSFSFIVIQLYLGLLMWVRGSAGNCSKCTLFKLRLNDIITSIPHFVLYSLYVDDLALYISGESPLLHGTPTSGYRGQNHIVWRSWGFVYCWEKLRTISISDDLHIMSFNLSWVSLPLLAHSVYIYTQAKFLDLIIDNCLPFPLTYSCSQSSLSLFSNHPMLPHFYIYGKNESCFISSSHLCFRNLTEKLGSIIYGQACKFRLLLDSVQNDGFSIATRVYRFSQVF